MRHPDWLKGEALWAWQQLAQVLGPEQMDVLGRGDRHALAMLCDAYREYRLNRRVLDKEGYTYRTVSETGNEMVRKHPAAEIAASAWRRVLAGLRHFGLTPDSRENAVRLGEPQGDSLEELLKRRNA